MVFLTFTLPDIFKTALIGVEGVRPMLRSGWRRLDFLASADRERVHRLDVEVVHGLRLVHDDNALHRAVVSVQREDQVTGLEVTGVDPAVIGVERMRLMLPPVRRRLKFFIVRCGTEGIHLHKILDPFST